MKYYLLLFPFLLLSAYSTAQTSTAKELFRSARSEFDKEFDEQDYKHAADLLEQAVKLEPDNAEYHYFLGYAYSRVNSKDGRSIPDMSKELTSKTSEQFEITNKLSPNYTGEKLILDPYSKISSEWGSLAMKHEAANQPDSVIWALKEGRRRGGFSDFMLFTMRSALDLCTSGSLLFSSGDAFIFPIMYLQKVDNYRTDVTQVAMSLLETEWYPHVIQNKYNLSFGRDKKELDTLSYCYCTDSIFRIPADINKGGPYSWMVRGRKNSYLFRSDRLFLDLLINNQCKREVYIMSGMPSSDLLDLNQDLSSLIIVNWLNYEGRHEELSPKEFETKITALLECMKYVNPDSSDELFTVNLLRSKIVSKMITYYEQEDFQSTRRLMQLLNKKIPANLYPIDDYTQERYEYIRIKLEEIPNGQLVLARLPEEEIAI